MRRLLILVQRLALREGRELVFEPNGPDLRRLIQTRFESALGLMPHVPLPARAVVPIRRSGVA